jgi:hypothetical protein
VSSGVSSPRLIVRQFQSLYTPSPRCPSPRYIVRQFLFLYTPSPRGLSRINARLHAGVNMKWRCNKGHACRYHPDALFDELGVYEGSNAHKSYQKRQSIPKCVWGGGGRSRPMDVIYQWRSQPDNLVMLCKYFSFDRP